MFHGLAVLRLRAEQDDLRVPSDLLGLSWWPIEKIGELKQEVGVDGACVRLPPMDTQLLRRLQNPVVTRLEAAIREQHS
jgi:hypothetical protein